MSKLRSDELVNKEGTGGPNFPQGITTIDPSTDNHVASKSYVDATVSFYGGNTFSPTAPATPAIGSFWTDTSSAPCVLKVWSGYDWIEFDSDESYTGVIESPVNVYTPFEDDGTTFDYLATTDIIESTSHTFLSGMIDQRNDTGLLQGREDYSISGRPDGSQSYHRICSMAYGKGTYVLLHNQEGIAYSKTGGTTWTVVPFPEPTFWYKVIYTGDDNFGGRFVAIGSVPGKQAMWSDDGVTWNLATTVPSDGFYYDLDIDPVSGRIVAAGQAPQYSTYSGRSPYMYSDDGGENWTRSGKSYQNWQGKYAIAYGNGVWVSPGQSKSSPSNAKHYPEWSSDGITWNVVNSTSGGTQDYAFESIVFDADNGRFVSFGAHGSRDGYSPKYATTIDGKTWTTTTIPSDSQGSSYTWDVDYNHVVYGNGVFIIGGKLSSTGATNNSQQGYKITNTWTPGGAPNLSEQLFLPTKEGSTDWDASRITAMEYIDDRFVIACSDGSIFMTERELPFGTLPTFSTDKQQGSFVNLKSSRIFKLENEEFVPNFEVSNIFDGTFPVRDIGTQRDVEILSLDGTTIQVPSTDGITVGNRLQITEKLLYGLDPNVVKFTSRNAGSPIVKSTDALLSFRRWTLESRVFEDDPWTLVTEEDDYSPVADQNGIIPWAGRPALGENTQYRVKVAYHSTNAETVESNYQYFQTGTAGAGVELFTEGDLIRDEHIVSLSYESISTSLTIKLSKPAGDFNAAPGRYVDITDSPLSIANGLLPILSVDNGASDTEGFIEVKLSGFTPVDAAEVSWSDPAAEIRVKSQVVAELLGYREGPLVIASSMIDSVSTIAGAPDAYLKLSSGVFSSVASTNVGDMVQISGAETLPVTMDPLKGDFEDSGNVRRTLSEDNLTIRNVGRNTFPGRCYSTAPMLPNTGIYYWEVSSTTFADENNILPTSSAAFEILLAEWPGHTGGGGTSTADWRMKLSQENEDYPVGDARRKTAYVYDEWRISSVAIPHYAGEVAGFEYNSNTGQLKVSFDGVEIYNETHSFLVTRAQWVTLQENYIGNEITFAFERDSWQYAPSTTGLKEVGAGDSNVNGMWEITNINDDEVDGPPLRLSTFAHEYGTTQPLLHTLGATTTSGDSYYNASWIYVTLDYPVSAIEFSAEGGENPGQGSRNLNGKYYPIKLYQIKVNGSIVSTTNTYSGTLTGTKNISNVNNAFATFSTAANDAASMTFSRYSTTTSESVSDTYPLGTNVDRYWDLGVMTFTPGREIPRGSTIGIKVSNGIKITYLCGTTYSAHDGSVMTLSKSDPTSIADTKTTLWSDDQPGTLSIGAPETFVDDSGDSSSGSGSSSGGSGSSSGGSGSSSGGGY